MHGREVSVDTGFIVYNPPAYPNLTALFARLKVPTVPSNMSFSVSMGGGAYEYAGTGLAQLVDISQQVEDAVTQLMTKRIEAPVHDFAVIEAALGHHSAATWMAGDCGSWGPRWMRPDSLATDQGRFIQPRRSATARPDWMPSSWKPEPI